MQLFVNGKAQDVKMYENIVNILGELYKTINVPKGAKIFIEDVQFKVAFEIDGVLQYATVTRVVGDKEVPEILQIAVKLNDEGEVVYQEDNEEESFYDGYTVAQAAGVEYEYEGIESMYSNEEIEVLDFIESREEDDKKVVGARYIIKEDPEHILVRYYKGEKLVAEQVIEDFESKENN